MKHFFISLILLLMTTVTFSQSSTFSLYVINPTNCPYSLTGTWFDTGAAGGVSWNSVDSTSSPSQDVWSATALTNTSTDSMMICVVPAGCCSQVCIKVPVNQQSYTIQLCPTPPPITTFSLYVINPTNCPYTYNSTWFDTGGAGSVNWNSVDSTSSPSQDVWSGSVPSNSSTDSMIICIIPAGCCSQVCIRVPVNQQSYTIQLCPTPPPITNFSLYVINQINCPYSLTGAWFDNAVAGNVAFNSVDSTSSPSQDVWQASVQSNSPTDSMLICIAPAGCCSTVCIKVPVNSTAYTLQLCAGVGINEIVKENNFSVFPNPAENKINVKVDATLLGSVYKVYDSIGKSVLSGKINSENTIIELSDLSAGIYLFSVGENMKQSFKVIKE